MTNEAVAVAAIVMTGVVLSVIAWQLLAIARTAVARDKHAGDRILARVEALEDLHSAAGGPDHQRDDQPGS